MAAGQRGVEERPGWRRALPGRETKDVSAIGFGASPLGGVFGHADEHEAALAVDRAFSRGISLFDTSPFYGSGASEQALGRCLAASESMNASPRSSLYLCSKVGRYGPSSFDFSGEAVRKSVFTSLARLGTAYLDAVHMHDVEFADLNHVTRSALPALEQLRREGHVRNIGVSALPLSALRKLFSLAKKDERGREGTPDLCLSYCRSNLLDSSFDQLLQPELASKHVGCINASPLAMGLLTNAGPPSWHPAPQSVKDACGNAARHTDNLAGVALRSCIQRTRASCTLVGMRSRDEVDSNIDAAIEALSGKWQSELAHSLSGVETELDPVRGMTWPSGLAENNDFDLLAQEQRDELYRNA